jgi:hypothetical protein
MPSVLKTPRAKGGSFRSSQSISGAGTGQHREGGHSVLVARAVAAWRQDSTLAKVVVRRRVDLGEGVVERFRRTAFRCSRARMSCLLQSFDRPGRSNPMRREKASTDALGPAPIAVAKPCGECRRAGRTCSPSASTPVSSARGVAATLSGAHCAREWFAAGRAAGLSRLKVVQHLVGSVVSGGERDPRPPVAPRAGEVEPLDRNGLVEKSLGSGSVRPHQVGVQ